MTKNSYNRYPTGLKLAYAAGTLPKNNAKRIPGSTRQRWKTLSPQDFWLPPYTTFDSDNLLFIQLLQENTKLKQLLRLAARIILVYKKTFARVTLQPDTISLLIVLLNPLINTATALLPTQDSWKWLPFSARQWAAWTSRKRCRASVLNLCRRQHPAQVTTREQQQIITACYHPDYKHWPLSSIYYQLMRTEKIHCSISTFYKYCRLLKITKKPTKKPVHVAPLRADAPFKIVHMDITIYKTQDGIRHYIYVIRDNYSRAILACKAALQYSSAIAKETLHAVLAAHNLLNKEGILVTDDGSENKGEVLTLLNHTATRWKKQVAQVDIVQSNSMVEAANKIIKQRFLYRLQAANTAQLIQQLADLQLETSNTPMRCLYGYTPQEVLDGAIPDKHFFKHKIAAAKAKRIKVHQLLLCTDTC